MARRKFVLFCRRRKHRLARVHADNAPSHFATNAQIESFARDSYRRLLAYLAARSGDVAGAEDALSEAFVAALQRWPMEGLPEKPEAWLLTAARRRMIDAARHAEVRDQAAERLLMASEMAELQVETKDHFPDERLKLLFVCAHPAIDASVRTPLMLQTVMGLDAARIASAFLTSPDSNGSAFSAGKKRKSAMRASLFPFRPKVNCRCGCNRCWRQFIPPTPAAGTTARTPPATG